MSDFSPDLLKTLEMINKRYGQNTAVILGQSIDDFTIDVVPTQSLKLNRALGVGGLPRGRIIELYGVEHSGKTSLALGVIAEAQKIGGKAAYIDAEYGFNADLAKLIGVDLDKLIYVQPSSGEEALDIAEALIRSGQIDVLVIDSVPALVPMAENESDMQQQHVGLQGRLMSKACRKLTAVIGKTKTVCIFINQLREKVGVMFGNPETTPGGRALKYFSSVRIEVRRGEDIKAGDKIIGHTVRCVIKKNKVAAPFRRAEFAVLYDSGIDRVGEILDLALEEGLITRSGAWFTCDLAEETLRWQGRDAVLAYMREHPEFVDQLAAILSTPSGGEVH